MWNSRRKRSGPTSSERSSWRIPRGEPRTQLGVIHPERPRKREILMYRGRRSPSGKALAPGHPAPQSPSGNQHGNVTEAVRVIDSQRALTVVTPAGDGSAGQQRARGVIPGTHSDRADPGDQNRLGREGREQQTITDRATTTVSPAVDLPAGRDAAHMGLPGCEFDKGQSARHRDGIEVGPYEQPSPAEGLCRPKLDAASEAISDGDGRELPAAGQRGWCRRKGEVDSPPTIDIVAGGQSARTAAPGSDRDEGLGASHRDRCGRQTIARAREPAQPVPKLTKNVVSPAKRNAWRRDTTGVHTDAGIDTDRKLAEDVAGPGGHGRQTGGRRPITELPERVVTPAERGPAGGQPARRAEGGAAARDRRESPGRDGDGCAGQAGSVARVQTPAVCLTPHQPAVGRPRGQAGETQAAEERRRRKMQRAGADTEATEGVVTPAIQPAVEGLRAHVRLTGGQTQRRRRQRYQAGCGPTGNGGSIAQRTERIIAPAVDIPAHRKATYSPNTDGNRNKGMPSNHRVRCDGPTGRERGVSKLPFVIVTPAIGAAIQCHATPVRSESTDADRRPLEAPATQSRAAHALPWATRDEAPAEQVRPIGNAAAREISRGNVPEGVIAGDQDRLGRGGNGLAAIAQLAGLSVSPAIDLLGGGQTTGVLLTRRDLDERMTSYDRRGNRDVVDNGANACLTPAIPPPAIGRTGSENRAVVEIATRKLDERPRCCDWLRAEMVGTRTITELDE